MATRSTTRALERLAARRDSARSRRELNDVLAGLHGEGVRADVLAAMKRDSCCSAGRGACRSTLPSSTATTRLLG